MVGYNESDDMLRWDGFQLALKPDEEDGTTAPVVRVIGGAQAVAGGDTTEDVSPSSTPMDFYAPGIFKYQEAPQYYFAMISAFYHWQSDGKHTFPDTGRRATGFQPGREKISASRESATLSSTGSGRKLFLEVRLADGSTHPDGRRDLDLLPRHQSGSLRLAWIKRPAGWKAPSAGAFCAWMDSGRPMQRIPEDG